MPKKPSQPLIGGYSVGKRPVIDGRMACLDCGVLKDITREHWPVNAKSWGRWCHACRAEQNATLLMTQRIKKHGLLAEIAGIQAAERELERRKARLAAYIERTKKP